MEIASPTSLLCVRKPGGTLQIHENKVVEELSIGIDAEDNIITVPYDGSRVPGRRRPRPHTSPKPSTHGHRVEPQSLVGQSLRLQGWLSEKTIKDLQDKADTESKSTKKMYEAVLDTEDTFVKDVSSFLDQKEMLDLRKREMLHKKWNDRVFEPIRGQVVRAVNGREYCDLDRRKRELYKEYLEHVNRKGHVFLDTISPEEYYPLSLHPIRPSLLKAETGQLRDPLLSQGRERTAEDRVIWRCMTGTTLSDRDVQQIQLPPLPLRPLGRHGTDCHTWLAMPMGDIESPVREASRSMWNGHCMNHQHYHKTP